LPELQLDRAVPQELNFVTLGPPTVGMKAVIDATRELATLHIN